MTSVKIPQKHSKQKSEIRRTGIIEIAIQIKFKQ